MHKSNALRLSIPKPGELNAKPVKLIAARLKQKALKPLDRQEAVDWLVQEQLLPAARACRLMNVSRFGWYRDSGVPAERDGPVIARLNEVISKHGHWGFWKCFHWLRQRGETWNHKRVLRVYRSIKLNHPRRDKRRLPARLRLPLEVPSQADRKWSMDFMHDTLYHGKRFRTLNVLDKGVREVLAIEIDTSSPAERVIRVLEQLKESRPLPQQIRVNNGPELTSSKPGRLVRDPRRQTPSHPALQAHPERLHRALQPYLSP